MQRRKGGGWGLRRGGIDTIRGNEMFVSRKEKSVTRASILVAYKKAQELGCVTGPKQLGVFGASYLYPVFLRLGIICASAG
ncbi:MAG: hypothetical protein V8R18_03505 [Clostridium sp.]